MRNFKEALNKETLFRPENRNVIIGDETPHAKRGCSVSTLIARVSREAIDMVGSGNMKIALQSHKKFNKSAGKRKVPLSMSDAKRDTGRVFGVKENAQTSAAMNERIRPNEKASAKPESSAALLLQDVAPRNAG